MVKNLKPYNLKKHFGENRDVENDTEMYSQDNDIKMFFFTKN